MHVLDVVFMHILGAACVDIFNDLKLTPGSAAESPCSPMPRRFCCVDRDEIINAA